MHPHSSHRSVQERRNLLRSLLVLGVLSLLAPTFECALLSDLAPADATAGSEPGQVVTQEKWRTMMRDCRKYAAFGEQRLCMDSTVALLPSMAGSQKVIDYFFKAEPYPGIRFRTKACKSRKPRGGRNYGGDIVWKGEKAVGANPENGTSSTDDSLPCLWGNMPFGKSIEIILLARNLGVTHIIESGRMGGMSLLHYDHFGFNLTSVELLPVEHVEASLHSLYPHIKLLDGDGMKLVPKALYDILANDPAARVLVIIDGPKDKMAQRLAEQILKRTALVVLDDQAVKRSLGGPATYSSGKMWRNLFPMSRDRSILMGPPNPPKEFQWDARFYCRDDDTSTFVLGGAHF